MDHNRVSHLHVPLGTALPREVEEKVDTYYNKFISE